MRKGRLTKIEKQFITDNCEHKTYDLIAGELDRDPNSIKNYIEKTIGKETSLASGGAPIKDVKNDISKKEVWPILQQEFSPPELDILVYQWNNMQAQFDHDVLPTEEMQILDLIKMDIMMHRSLNEQRECSNSVSNINAELEMFGGASSELEKEDKMRLEELQRQLMSYRTGYAALSKECREIQTQKNKLFSELKATRKDRIQRIDSKKESFMSWVEDIIENPQTRKELGNKMEKMRLGAEIELKRLSEWHKFEDGMVDQPILNSDTVLDDD